MSHRHAKLLASLAEVGITEDDYKAINRARRLVDEVNAHLAARESPVRFAIPCVTVTPMREDRPSQEIWEQEITDQASRGKATWMPCPEPRGYDADPGTEFGCHAQSGVTP